MNTLNGLHHLPRRIGRSDAGWVDGQALARLVTAARPGLYLPSPNRDGWFIADNNGGPLGIDTDAGRRVAEALFAAQFRGPMRWLGLVETAVGPAGDAWAVRLSPLGRAVVTGDETALTANVDARWDEASASVSLALDWNTAAALDVARQCGAYVGPAGADAPPGAIVFRIGPDTLQRVFGDGVQPAEVSARFAAVGAPLPASVGRAIETWWATWGSVNSYDGLALIQVADEHLAQVLRATTALRNIVIYQIDPTGFVVAEEAVDALLDELRRAGHTPSVAIGADAAMGADARATLGAKRAAPKKRPVR